MNDDEPGFGLFVRNMVFEANEDHLREAYEKYGEITKAVVARDARGLSRGYVTTTSSQIMRASYGVGMTNNPQIRIRMVHHPGRYGQGRHWHQLVILARSPYPGRSPDREGYQEPELPRTH